MQDGIKQWHDGKYGKLSEPPAQTLISARFHWFQLLSTIMLSIDSLGQHGVTSMLCEVTGRSNGKNCSDWRVTAPIEEETLTLPYQTWWNQFLPCNTTLPSRLHKFLGIQAMLNITSNFNFINTLPPGFQNILRFICSCFWNLRRSTTVGL